jgi:hypothetical protein
MANPETAKTENFKPKAKYGIDAPGVIRNLALAGVICCGLPVFLPLIKIGSLKHRYQGDDMDGRLLQLWDYINAGLFAIRQI